MARYEVGHDYASWRDGKRLGPWEKGAVVDVDEADAEFVEVDSPGALKAVKAEKPAAKKAAEKP